VEFLNEGTILGSLKVLEVYEYYDGPRLFACVNGIGSIFLMLWTRSTDAVDQYYVQPISIQRFREVRSGELILRDAFSSVEENGLLVLEIDHQGDSVLLRSINNDYIEESLLPLHGETLEIEAPLPFTKLKMEGKKRHIVELSLSSNVSFGVIGKLVESFERLVNSAASKIYRRPRQSLSLDITFVSVGSFVVDAVLPEPQSEEELDTQARILELVMRALSDPGSVIEESFGETALRAFAQAVLKSTDGVRVSWSDARAETSHSVRFSREGAEAAWGGLQLVASRPPARIEVTEHDRSVAATAPELIDEAQSKAGFFVAIFKAVDLEKNLFAAYDAQRDRIFRGTIGSDARRIMETSTLGVPYLVRIVTLRRAHAVLVEVQPTRKR
jgi:hypothetical protein